MSIQYDQYAGCAYVVDGKAKYFIEYYQDHKIVMTIEVTEKEYKKTFQI